MSNTEQSAGEQEQSSSSSAQTAAASDPVDDTNTTSAPSQWQAIWAPQYNAYYFYNAVTQETTWTNPLQPEESSPSSSVSVDRADTVTPNESLDDTGSNSYSAAASHHAALQAAATAQGIDPGLAYLDPSLRDSLQGPSFLPGEVPTFTAQFNAHTGRFAAPSSRTPGHLSEYERMKRMSEFYFDVNQWQEDLAREQEGESSSAKKKKRPSKKDLERFKQQKKLKKIAKTAWLRT